MTPALSPPYYAVIFTSLRTEGDHDYAATSRRMVELARKQPGFLGVDSAREQGLGITVSYWSDVDAIRGWRQQAEHRVAQERGKSQWYQCYRIRICKVESEYGFESDAEDGA